MTQRAAPPRSPPCWTGRATGRQAGQCGWCGQREVIPDLVAGLTATWGDDRHGANGLADLPKGALALLHLDDRSRLVGVERLPD